MDRLLLAAIQARQEFAYYEATPILAVICQHLERLNNVMNELHLRVPPSTLLKLQIAPTGGFGWSSDNTDVYFTGHGSCETHRRPTIHGQH